MPQQEHLFVERELDAKGKTLKPIRTPGAADSISRATPLPQLGAEDESDQFQMDEESEASSIAASSIDLNEPLALLTKLKSSFRADEFELYALLKDTTIPHLNDVRKAFNDASKSAKNRLSAWSKKHLTKAELSQLGELQYTLPEYSLPGHHAFPGSQYVIREDEPLSIIAFSLSSKDFEAELRAEMKAHASEAPPLDKTSDVLNWRSGVVEGNGSQISSTPSSKSSAAASAATGVSSSRQARVRAPPGPGPLDPDRDELFYTPEPVNVHMKRKKRARDTSMLSLRLRRVRSTLSATSATESREPQTPSTEMNLQLGDTNETGSQSGRTVVDEEAENEENDLCDNSISIDPNDSTSISNSIAPSSPRPGSLATSGSSSFDIGTVSSSGTNSTFRAQITQVTGRPGSLASIFSKDANDAQYASSNAETGNRTGDGRSDETVSRPGSRYEEKDVSLASTSLNAIWSMGSGFHSFKGGRSPSKAEGSATLGLPNSSVVELSGENLTHPIGSAPSTSSQANALPHPHQPAESPHIKHNLFHGHTKVSCVSWFAAEFSSLRQKWGIEDDFVESLSRCKSWNASGGKSKSAFFKTQDERFIAKQLLTVWSVDEKEAFLEFAPAYIKYMMNSVVNDCPTLLVKIAGVYSIKIKDTRSGETKLKMNVMLLENLFTGDEGKSVRFDLKGIKDRKVKTTFSMEDGTAVWWDGEWIESELRCKKVEFDVIFRLTLSSSFFVVPSQQTTNRELSSRILRKISSVGL